MAGIPIQQKWPEQNLTMMRENNITVDQLLNQINIENVLRNIKGSAWSEYKDHLPPISTELPDLELTTDIRNLMSPVNDILFGLDQTKHVGTNYYKKVGQCKYDDNFKNCYNIYVNKNSKSSASNTDIDTGSNSSNSSNKSDSNSSSEENKIKLENKEYLDCVKTYGSKLKLKDLSNPPDKYMFIRTIPLGNALTRMGLADKGVTSFGKIFSMVEDIMDFGKLEDLFSRSKSESSSKDIYSNCVTKPFTTETNSDLESNKQVRLYDDNNIDLTYQPIYQEFKKRGNIEMFSNQNKNTKITNILLSLFVVLIVVLLIKFLIKYKKIKFFR